MTERDRMLLVALADGTLRGRRRARAEARVRALPDGSRLLARQRRVRGALAAPEEQPPHSPTPAARAPQQPALRWPPPARRWAPRAVPVIAALSLLALIVPSYRERSVVAEAAELSQRPATAPAAVATRVEGVPFPDWRRDFGWIKAGSRRDTVGGRAATTVFYEHRGHRLAYTILPGPPARPPGEARIVRRGGAEIAIWRDPRHGGHDIAVFERAGRTCVIAGHVERISTLVALAAWRDG
jgi:hypothetical protein